MFRALSHWYTAEGSFLLFDTVQQEEGNASHLHHVQPPPVFVSASQDAWSVWVVLQGSFCASTLVDAASKSKVVFIVIQVLMGGGTNDVSVGQVQVIIGSV